LLVIWFSSRSRCPGPPRCAARPAAAPGASAAGQFRGC